MIDYVIKFFKIDFSENHIFFPENVTQLNNYLNAHLVQSMQKQINFFENQTQIIVQSSLNLSGVNYMTICPVGGATNDTLYYYVMGTSSPNTQTLTTSNNYTLEIKKDLWFCDFFKFSTNGELNTANYSIKNATVAQTTYKPFLDTVKKRAVNIAYNSPHITETYPFMTRGYNIVFSLVFEDASIEFYSYKTWNETGLTAGLNGDLVDAMQKVQRIAKIVTNPSNQWQVGNVSLLNAYIVPFDFFEKTTTNIVAGLTGHGGSDTINIHNLNLSRPSFGTTALIVDDYEDSARRAFFKTATDKIEIEDFKGYVNIFWQAQRGQPDIFIGLEANGEMYDITNAFKMPITQNANAVYATQHAQSLAIQSVAGVVGAVGGVVGGLASGNYFGAVQSAFGGISSVLDKIDATSTPASVRTSGNGIFNCERWRCGTLLYYGTNTDSEKQNYINYFNYYGYLTFYHLNEMQIYENNFYMCQNLQISGNFPRSNAEYFERKFKEGVRFFNGS